MPSGGNSGGGGGGGGAPVGARYVVTAAHADLTAEVLLSATNSQGTYAARPAAAAANEGYAYYATDIGVTFRSTGSAWTVISDPWGFKFFEDEGFLTSGMALEVGGLTTWPAQSETILPVGAAFAITDSEAKSTLGGTSGNVIAAWTLSPAKSVILAICHSLLPGTMTGTGLFVQNAALAGTEIDNAYLVGLDNVEASIYRESAGFTKLASDDEIRNTAAAVASGYGVALYYNDATDRIRSFIRCAGTWFEALTVTDATFTTMVRVGLRSGAVVNSIQRTISPFLVFTQA